MQLFSAPGKTGTAAIIEIIVSLTVVQSSCVREIVVVVNLRIIWD